MDLWDCLDNKDIGDKIYTQNEFEDERSNHIGRKGRDRLAYINEKLIKSDIYVNAIKSLNESKQCTNNILSSAREMLAHHHGDKYEDLYFIDSITNKVLSQTMYKIEKQVEPTMAMKKMALQSKNIISIHNHPTNGLPSMADFTTCRDINYQYGIVVCHNGSIYKYKVIGELNEPHAEMALNIYQRAENESIGTLFNYDTYKQAHYKNIKELKRLLYDANIYFEEVLWYGNYTKNNI